MLELGARDSHLPPPTVASEKKLVESVLAEVGSESRRDGARTGPT